MTTQPIVQVDAFTDKAFAGNPAAVCILPKMADEAWMQAVAAEMNLAETAFVAPHEDPFKRAWQLRWFTSTIEVNLCGHATLASAHTLWTEGYLRPDEPAKFDTLSGRLTCTYNPNGWITMDFPALEYEECDLPDQLSDALGGVDGRCFRNAYAADYYRYVLLLDNPDIVRTLAPDMSKLATIASARATIVTAADEGDYDFISRYFAPRGGNPEDPVTGSAHCVLAPIWAAELHKTDFIAQQVSQRGGVLKLSLDGDRVKISGQAVTVMKGNLLA